MIEKLKKRFILTQEDSTAELLKKDGFTYRGKQGKTHVFINDGRITFSEKEHKMVYTNILSV